MENFNWKKTNTPKAVRYDDIWFIDENIGWTINSNGEILHTKDGGNSWKLQFRMVSTGQIWMRCIAFTDEKNGWVGTVTGKNRLYKTTDGGDNWIPVDNLPAQPTAICGLCLAGSSTIYCSGTNWPNRPTAILKSSNNGESWTRIDMNAHASLLVDIYFKDENTGWVVGGIGGKSRRKIKPVVLFTADGGKTWINQLEGQADQFPLEEWGWKIQFLNENIGYVALENPDDAAILKTIDGGKNWKRIEVNDPQNNANLEGIGFINEKTGWVGGWGNRFQDKGYSSSTLDGGETWKDANEIGRFINRFRFTGNPLKVGYASGDAVYKYSPISNTIEESIDANKNNVILNQDSELHDSEFQIEVMVPKSTTKLEVDIWDHFGEHIARLAEIESPNEGKNSFSFKFPKNENAPDIEHYVYRVSVDGVGESQVVLKNNLKNGDNQVKSLTAKLKNEKTSEVPPLPSVEEEKEAFHRLVNIEDYPEFRDVAVNLARNYLGNANYEASALYNEFDYTPEAFSERLKNIYEAYLPNMHKPHAYDRNIIEWSNGKQYKVGRASNKVVKDRLLQFAPFNLLDGVWLQNIMQARPSDEVQTRLFEIWADEVGNGSTRENHANVYQDLLRSQGLYLPDVTSREFINLQLSDGAWRSTVFQMTIGLFPQMFFPELLGMTLLLEWEATPTTTPTANMLKGRGINPLFYSLHVAIDNISEGHGALAKEAIEIFLSEKREEGGDLAVQQNWKRIWNGYVAWATAGFGGLNLQERRLIIDKIAINLGTPEEPQCFPNWKSHYHNQMVNLITKKAPSASQVHGNSTLGGEGLNNLFEDPTRLMQKLIDSKMVNIESPRQSKFLKLMEFEGPMYKVFSDEEKNTILDWIESLSETKTDCINPITDEPGGGSNYSQVIQLIENYAGIAARAHGSLTLPNEAGKPEQFTSFLNNPKRLLEAMIRGGWIIPGNSDRSIFISRIILDSGPMDGIFDEDSVQAFIKWIDQGANFEEEIVSTKKSINWKDNPLEELSILRPFIGQGGVH